MRTLHQRDTLNLGPKLLSPHPGVTIPAASPTTSRKTLPARRHPGRPAILTSASKRSSGWAAPSAPSAPAYEAMPGAPEPLGASPGTPDTPGVNFAVLAPAATAVHLCLFAAPGSPMLEAPMTKAGDVWTAFVPNLPQSGVLYGFRVEGTGGNGSPYRWCPDRVLLDPYAKLVAGRKEFGVRDEVEQFQPTAGSQFLGTYDFGVAPFDWGATYSRPNLPFEDLIIAELPVRTFTADASSGLAPSRRGTFLGIADKIPHLLETGVNAVELLPVFEYDELEFQRSPNPRDHMVNVWGYSHLNFFAPMSRFAAAGGGPAAAAVEFKEMVRRLHAAGIEVILDVVYNHTAEADDRDPYPISWRGIDSKLYYQQDPAAETPLLNYSGCGNTVSGNHPLVMSQIMDSLRWWVEEYHVDGFRFDLASCLCRDEAGRPLDAPPLIRAIAKDPVLAGVKLIAEPWDIGMYQVGSFPAWDRWAEWNGKYRDDVRRFIRGDPGFKPQFATRIAGSADLYAPSNRKPYHSINFIIAHDGFTLADLVAYNEKHNDANGEGNRDGTNDNFSWNCGAEGATDNAAVVALRARQMRNLHLALMLSQGTPMVLIGDEAAASHQGNNNWYGHDGPLTHYNWGDVTTAKEAGWFRFYSGLIKLRKECPLLGRAEFLAPGDVTWHEDRWDDPESRFLAFTLHDHTGGYGDLYAAFNAHSFEVSIGLPAPPAGKKWTRVVDTNLPSPRDFTPGGNAGVDPTYVIQANSAVLLLAKNV